MDRVAGGQRHRGDLRHCPCVIRSTRAAHIGALPARIGADHEKVRAFPLVLVGNAGWDHHDIAGAQLNGLAALAAQSRADPTSGDAEHLVHAL